MKSILITGIEPIGPVNDLGADAAKKMPPGRRHRYTRAVRYTLENGETVPGMMRGLTKPKLKESFERSAHYSAKKSLFAEFNDAGEMWGTKVTFGF